MLGWVSVIGLIYLNMKGLPDQIEGFFGDNPTASQITLADNIAYVIIALVILLLVWTVVELYKGDKRYVQQLAAMEQQVEEVK